MQKNLSRALSAAAFIGLSALGGCVIAVDGDGDAYEANWDLDREYEILKAADVSGNTVTARVKSNGCTTKEFIDADVRKMNDNRFSVGFHRARPDYCRALLEDGVALTWSFAELGIPDGAEVSVRNTIGN